MNNIYLFGILSALSTVEGYQRTGSFSYQPYEAKPSMRFSYDFYGEGLAYDAKRDRLLLGTLSSGGPSVQGRIYSVPYFNSKIYNDETIITYDESDMFLVFQGNLSYIKSIAGLEMDKNNADIVWAATADYPPTNDSPCGVVKVNIVTGMEEKYYDLTPFRSSYSGKCMSNDIVFDDDSNFYVTDFYGYQIIKVNTLTDDITVLTSDEALLCNPQSGSCPPEAESLYSTNGPNGIEFDGNYLIVAISTNRVVRVDKVTGAALVIEQFPPDAIQGADGIIFNSAKNELYIAGFGAKGSVTYATLNEDSTKIMVHLAYSASCVNDGATAVAVIKSDIAVLCTNNFGSAPYNVSVLSDIVDDSRLNMQSSSTFNYYGFTPEGIEFDPYRSLVISGSAAMQGVYGLYPFLNDGNITVADMYPYVDNTIEMQSSVIGIHREDCILYGAVNAPTKGVAVYDICVDEEGGAFVRFIDLSSLTDSSDYMNDIVSVSDKDTQSLYVTTWTGNKVIKIENPHSSDAEISLFLTMKTMPNGIEYDGEGYLLTGNQDGIYRIDLFEDTPIPIAITKDTFPWLIDIDGMFFNDDNTVLFVVMNGLISETSGFDAIIALTSDDSWSTADVVGVFRANCPDEYPTTATMVDQTLFVVCVDSFGPGPYQIRYSLQSIDSLSNTDVESDEDDTGAYVDKKDGLTNLEKGLIVCTVIIGIGMLIGVTFIMYKIVMAGENSTPLLSPFKRERMNSTL